MWAAAFGIGYCDARAGRVGAGLCACPRCKTVKLLTLAGGRGGPRIPEHSMPLVVQTMAQPGVALVLPNLRSLLVARGLVPRAIRRRGSHCVPQGPALRGLRRRPPVHAVAHAQRRAARRSLGRLGRAARAGLGGVGPAANTAAAGSARGQDGIGARRDRSARRRVRSRLTVLKQRQILLERGSSEGPVARFWGFWRVLAGRLGGGCALASIRRDKS